MKPNKLKIGDEIRIIAPSRSMDILSNENIELAQKRLEEMGFKISYGKNVMNKINDDILCASIQERIEDLHEAFLDKKVKAILTVIGGFNVNQILEYIDYNIIKENPKIICGFSDITALSNAIYAKTGLITYSGVHFSSFGMKKGFEYSKEYFKKAMMEEKIIEIESSDFWSDDSWFKNQENREFIKNEGMEIINKGKAVGTIIGGNLCTLNLLQGTEYMPQVEGNIILFIEDDGLVGKEFLREFDRNLQSLLHTEIGKKVKGVIIGRCEKVSEMDIKKWELIIKTKKQLENIPVVVNANFGHTTPIFTFPIGGNVELIADETQNIRIKIY